jgi:HD superfamily phosphodiesterase
MHVDDQVRYSEIELRNELEEFFNRKYPEGQLVSHGLDHHRRVWEFAKELLHYSNTETNQQLVSSLMIACYLHDIGMAVDAGEKHGIQGRKYCEEFLSETGRKTSDYNDLLDAIENHDNKEYTLPAGNNQILNILTAADDLDAFGYTGILRYAEIYLRRGVKERDLAGLILENSARRFSNFEKNYSRSKKLIRKHRKRYMILKKFYSSFKSSI